MRFLQMRVLRRPIRVGFNSSNFFVNPYAVLLRIVRMNVNCTIISTPNLSLVVSATRSACRDHLPRPVLLLLTSTPSYLSRRKLVTTAAPAQPDQANTHTLRDEEFAALLSQAAKGDAHAFERFYLRTVNHAYAVARRVAGSNHCDDVLSDAYFQAWRDAARFDDARGNALAWLLVIVRTRALDRLRVENLRHCGLDGAPDVDTSAIEDIDVPGPETLLESIQTTVALHQAIANLSVNERWVLGLAYFRDHSQSEISAITGLPLGTVKSLLTRAQQKLRETLAPTHTSTVSSSRSSRASSRLSMP
jgi:RNA polymerase sigma-70 factor, ECF subfamily